MSSGTIPSGRPRRGPRPHEPLQARERALEASDLLGGRYRLERLIGRGGMAEVWLARDERLDRPVAVKVLDDRLSASGEFGDTLEHEARTIARLQHPNIVAVFDVGEHEGQHFLVMEYVHGSSLRDLLRLHGRLPWSDVVRIGRQAAAALAEAHHQGVVHCDIKPENILVDHHGVVKVTDFGVAEAVTRTMTADDAREILGTAAYLAPEVLEGSAPTPASDVYGLALTLYEAAAGRLPFQGPTPAAVAVQRLSTPPAPLRTFVPSAPPELESVLARALAREPEHRYPTGAELATALARVPVGPASHIAGAPGRPPAAPKHRTERLRPRGVSPARSSGGATWAALATIVAGLVIIGAAGAFVLRDAFGGHSTTPTPLPTLPPATATPPATHPATVETPTSTPTPTEAPTPTFTPTATPTPAPSPTPSPSPTPPPTPTPGPSPTPTP